MATQPKTTPELGQMGQRSRSTIPMTHERRALSEQSQFLTRDLCWRCAGTGSIDRPYVRCTTPGCQGIWNEQQIAAHMRHSWTKRQLPCGHATHGQSIEYLHPPCPTCGGARYLERWVSIDEFLTFLQVVFGGISEEVTARRQVQ